MSRRTPTLPASVAITREAARAHAKYGPYASTHEAYGVLAEEVAELLDAIRANDLAATRREAIQVAAVALRLATACGTLAEAFRRRSGGT